MIVEVSGQRFTFPQQCACCGGTPNTSLSASHTKTSGKRVVKSRTWSWEFPYCTSCLAHVSAYSNAAVAGWLVAIAGIGGAVFSAFIHEVLPYVIGVAALVAMVMAVSHLQGKARALCSPTCAVVTRAVSYVNWHGTAHTFDIVSRNYAALFMLSNAKKLLNLSTAAREVMNSYVSAALVATGDELESDDAVVSVSARPVAAPARQNKPQPTDDDQLLRVLSKLESLKGAASRRAVVEGALKSMASEEMKQRLLLEASRIEVNAVLDKVDALKTASAKKRTILSALDEIKADAVADTLQTKQIEMLESALREIEQDA